MERQMFIQGVAERDEPCSDREELLQRVECGRDNTDSECDTAELLLKPPDGKAEPSGLVTRPKNPEVHQLRPIQPKEHQIAF